MVAVTENVAPERKSGLYQAAPAEIPPLYTNIGIPASCLSNFSLQFLCCNSYVVIRADPTCSSIPVTRLNTLCMNKIILLLLYFLSIVFALYGRRGRLAWHRHNILHLLVCSFADNNNLLLCNPFYPSPTGLKSEGINKRTTTSFLRILTFTVWVT